MRPRDAVVQALAATNGGPGLTRRELAEETGQPEPWVRKVLSDLVLVEKTATCAADGRYKLGDPAALVAVAAED